MSPILLYPLAAIGAVALLCALFVIGHYLHDHSR